MVGISADVPEELKRRLDDQVSYPEQTRSDLIRDALRLYVELENPQEMIPDRDDTAPE